MKTVDENLQKAEHILRENDTGTWICPSRKLYPHQWLWDACFTAIGLRHVNAPRAAREIEKLLDAQWSNGMVPHMVFSPAKRYWLARLFWGTHSCDASPKHVLTSGITQPPVIATAALKVSEKLDQDEGRQFLRRVFPRILAYHEWLYNERDPENDGLVALIHHWETGMDNTPDWMELLENIEPPFWLKFLKSTGLIKLASLLRSDSPQAGKGQRGNTYEALQSMHLISQYRRACFDSRRILAHRELAVESLFFNTILIRANRCLESIANLIGEKIPNQTRAKFRQAESGLDALYDTRTHAYQARNVASKLPMRTVSISSLMAIYTGCINEKRAKGVVDMLKDETQFWPQWPVPSVPIHSPYFSEKRYWQGPAWVNTNWFIIEGLKLFGYDEEAEVLRAKTIDMVEKAGFYEYFSPLDGKGYGIDNFSWTAALYIDLKKS